MEAARALLTGCRLQLGQRSFISVPLPSLSGQPRISLPSHPDSIWPVSGALPEVGHCVGGVGGRTEPASLETVARAALDSMVEFPRAHLQRPPPCVPRPCLAWLGPSSSLGLEASIHCSQACPRLPRCSGDF